MARRRRHYARDRHGRFARTYGPKGQYKRKMSTRKKVAIAGAGAVAIGAVAVGTHAAYRAGARKGWEIGKVQGNYEGRPLRGKNGRMLPASQKKDYSQNPFARGNRPVGRMGTARPRPGVRTRIRAGRVAAARIDQNYVGGKRRLDGFHATRRASRARSSIAEMGRDRVRRQRSSGEARARRYNAAQARSQVVSGANNARRTAQRISTTATNDARIVSTIAGQKVRKARYERNLRGIQRSSARRRR